MSRTWCAACGQLDATTSTALEETLLAADMGLTAVGEAMEILRARSGEIAAGGDPTLIRQTLVDEVRAILDIPGPAVATARPDVIFIVGVNGAGKTTTIGKLAARYRTAGESTLIVAADTFRAAAVGQLKTWADRAGAAFHESREGPTRPPC